ncbi:MAG: hypothetical protein ACYC3I_06360 [Gemmataceae bacterium]
MKAIARNSEVEQVAETLRDNTTTRQDNTMTGLETINAIRSFEIAVWSWQACGNRQSVFKIKHSIYRTAFKLDIHGFLKAKGWDLKNVDNWNYAELKKDIAANLPPEVVEDPNLELPPIRILVPAIVGQTGEEREVLEKDVVLHRGYKLVECLGNMKIVNRHLLVFLRDFARDSYEIPRAWNKLELDLEELALRLKYDIKRPEKCRRMSADEANYKALELAKKDRLFVQRSQREWAKSIGCSAGLVSKLPLWRETVRQSRPQKRSNGSAPKAVRFTAAHENSLGEPDEELQRLIAEQEADSEPSPLEGDPSGSRPRTVRCYTRA